LQAAKLARPHWLLTPGLRFRHGEDAALFPSGGEDRYGRGGPSEGGSDAGRLASTAAWAGLV